jgi:hypothetical protein
MHFKTSKMPEEGRSKCKIKVWGVNTKIIFYKSHHPVHIKIQETKQCATPTTLNSHDMNTTDMWELSCGYFTGLNKTMLSKVTKFLKMHELFKKKKLPQWPINPTQNLTNISLVCTDPVQYKYLPQCTIFYAFMRTSHTHIKTTFFKKCEKHEFKWSPARTITHARNWLQQMTQSYTTSEENEICIFFLIL